MVARLRLFATVDFAADCGRIACPTLIVTGEPRLDRVVPVSSTLDYLRLIPASKHETIERTGHIGLITRPDRFADSVVRFSDANAHAHPSERRRA
jgi:pimeloyl-ACP methyl ester carboxylesterase